MNDEDTAPLLGATKFLPQLFVLTTRTVAPWNFPTMHSQATDFNFRRKFEKLFLRRENSFSILATEREQSTLFILRVAEYYEVGTAVHTIPT